MEFFTFLGTLVVLITDGVNNLINFIKDVPYIFAYMVEFTPQPIASILSAFLPIMTVAIIYKFVRGY